MSSNALRRRAILTLLWLSLAAGTSAHAQTDTTAPAAAAAPAAGNTESDETPPPGAAAEDYPDGRRAFRGGRRLHWRDANASDHDLVSVGRDVTLPKGESSDDVVAVFGNATADGDVDDSVVAVLGDVRVTGHVGDSAVAVIGDAYIDSKIEGNVVAVLGDVELGPHAEINGTVVQVIGHMQRDPGAIVHGGIEHIIAADFGGAHRVHAWIHECLMFGRPLAIGHDLGWAWGFALFCLFVYVLLALMFPDAVRKCAQTLIASPGRALLASILAVLLTPILLLLLLGTVIGIPLVPVVCFGLFTAGLFGKAAALACIGGRTTRTLDSSAASNIAVHVLVGGAIVLLLYIIPLIGFIVFTLLGVFGFGAVLLTLINTNRESRRERAAAAAAASSGAGPAGAASRAAPSPPPPPPPPAPESGPAGEPAAAAEPPPAAAAPAATAAASIDYTVLPRAGFLVRMGALILDALLVAIVLHLLHNSMRMDFIALAVYGALMWKLRSTTVGGIVCDLRVVRLDGRPIDWGTAIVRALGCFLSFAVVGLGFLWIAFDAEGQAWHDKMAGTIVVRVPRGASLV